MMAQLLLLVLHRFGFDRERAVRTGALKHRAN